jgi:hypothetical protein
MPRGAASFTRHTAAKEERRAEALERMGPIADYFSIEGGQIAIVRFLEQGEDLAYASLHRVPVANRKYPVDVLCLDQNDDGTPCPMCMSSEKEIRGRTTRGFVNLLWRGSETYQNLNAQLQYQNQQRLMAGEQPYMLYTLATTFKRGQNGIPVRDEQTKKKIVVGYADGVFLWKCSNTVHKLLTAMDQKYTGLMSRDFTIRREGRGVDDTTYYIDPLDVNVGAVPMSPVDQALYNGRYDLDKFILPGPNALAEAQQLLSGPAPGAPPGQFVRGAGVAVPPPVAPGYMVPGAPQQALPVPAGVNPFSAGAPMQANVPPIPPPPVVR